MWLDIHGRGLADVAVRVRLERRLAYALGRFGDRVRRVAVFLSDENGPKGGTDKVCRITAELPGVGRAVVEGVDSSLTAVIDRTADRVGQSVRRRLDRAREFGLSGLRRGGDG